MVVLLRCCAVRRFFNTSRIKVCSLAHINQVERCTPLHNTPLDSVEDHSRCESRPGQARIPLTKPRPADRIEIVRSPGRPGLI
ncbi:hypothetical protein RRG08_011807 [Elysia crispata]|uniref:Uncharacterized protein n=1 Tax=Elysia crispata TaxID=231223 RepID=A0AAE1AGT1_9GAST|nr:hypothetical protein RRG08_011807 [Elysia crispata]